MLSHAVWLCNINLQLFLFSRFCPNFPVISLYIIHNGCISSTHMHAHIFYFRYRPYTFFHFIFLYLHKKARHVTGVLSWFSMISVAYLIIFSSYSLIPRPIFSAWSRVAFHSIFGLESLKWSWWQCHPGSARCSPSWLLAIGVAFRQASAQAWSSATGSKLANIVKIYWYIITRYKIY